MFNLIRVYSNANGDTHFEDVEIPLKDAGDIGLLSENYPTKMSFSGKCCQPTITIFM